jgi:hypothetical protein
MLYVMICAIVTVCIEKAEKANRISAHNRLHRFAKTVEKSSVVTVGHASIHSELIVLKGGFRQ